MANLNDGSAVPQRIEQPLFDSWERLAGLVQSARDAIIVIDEQQRILLFNAAAVHMFGCSQQEAVGSHLERFVPPRFRAAHAAGFERVRQTDLDARHLGTLLTLCGLRATGEEFPCETSIAQHVVGGRREFAVIIRDITERQRSAEALRRRVTFETFLFELSRAFIGLPEDQVDANMERGLAQVGEFLAVDRVTLFELSRDRIEITVAYSWSAPGVSSATPAIAQRAQPWWVSQVLRGDVSLTSHVDDLPEEAAAEKEYLRQRGIASAASIPLRVGGEIAGAIGFVTVRRHVTWTEELVNQLRAIGDILWNALKRRQAMQALIAARNAARDSEEHLRLIANTVPVMIWMSDSDKQVTYVNQRWLDFTGWPPGVPVGNRWIESVHPDDVERCVDIYMTAFDQRQPYRVEYRVRRRDAEYRWAVTVGVPRYGTDRSFRGYVGTAVDITEHKLAEDALRQSHETLRERTAELERRTTQLSQLASDLTLVEQRAREQLAKTLHDGLQQQLAVAALHLEQQVNRDAERGIPVAALTRVKQELDEAIATARSLSIELFPPVLQSAGLPTALAWLAEWSHRKHGLEVHVTADPIADSPRKDIRTLLFESVRELLFNAVKHAQVNQATVDLTLDANRDLCIIVADHGRGFDPVELDKQADMGPVGWGLFSIRERLTLLGGQFDVESAPGRGTRFRLVAPAGTAHGDVGAGPPLTHAVIEPVSPDAAVGVAPRTLRILVVDDHAGFREALRDLLQARPEFEVVGEAASGLEAIAQSRLLRPDVILMDVSMPEMGGVEATGLIHAELPAILIFGLSTQERVADLHAIEGAGGVGYFFKGTDVKSLIDRLRKVRTSVIGAISSRETLIQPVSRLR